MQKNTANNSRIAHNTFFLYLRMTIVLFVSLYTARIVLQVLGADNYGIYNVVCGFVSLFSVLNVTLTNGTQRYYNEEIGKNNQEGVTNVFNAALRIQVLIAIILFLILEVIGIWYIDNKMVIAPERISAAHWIFQFSVLSLALTIIQAPFSSAIISFERMDFYALMSIFDVAVKLGLVYIIQRIDYDKLVIYGGLMAFSSLITFALNFGYCWWNFTGIKIKRTKDFELTKKLLSFSGWLILDPIAYTMRGQGCNMVLNLFFGTIINASYAIANQIGTTLDSFCSNISTAFKPQLMQSFAAGDYSRTIRLLYSMSKIMFILKLMICIPILFEIRAILQLWLGEEVPLYTVSFATLTIILRLLDALNSPISSVILAIGKIKKYMICTSTIVFMALPFSYLLFKYGCDPNATFIAMIAFTLINQFISVAILGQNCSFFSPADYSKKVVIPCILQIIFVVTGTAIIFLLFKVTIYRLPFVCIGSFVLTIVGSYYWVLNKNEKDFIKNLIQNKLRA